MTTITTGPDGEALFDGMSIDSLADALEYKATAPGPDFMPDEGPFLMQWDEQYKVWCDSRDDYRWSDEVPEYGPTHWAPEYANVRCPYHPPRAR